jgi:hypothetical protein
VEPGSNVKFARALQFLKQNLAIVLTDEGIQIDCSAAHSPNATAPRVEILEQDSNFTSNSLPQLLKQESQIASIDEGRQID